MHLCHLCQGCVWGRACGRAAVAVVAAVTAVFSPNSVATLWGSYGDRKASGVNRWCADPCLAVLATLSVKSSFRDRQSAFRLCEMGSRRGPFRSGVLACAPCRFSEMWKCAKREGFERRAKPSQRFSKLEVVKNDEKCIYIFRGKCSILSPWRSLKSLLESSKRSFCETVAEFGPAMLT